MDGKHGVKSIEIDLPKATLVDVPANQQSAVARCRWAQKNTWIGNVTITGVKVGSGNFPRGRHDFRGSLSNVEKLLWQGVAKVRNQHRKGQSNSPKIRRLSWLGQLLLRLSRAIVVHSLMSFLLRLQCSISRFGAESKR